MVINVIKYPNHILKETQTKVKIYGNRGMTLENDINLTNEYYLNKDIAVIYKKPTPIQVVKKVNNKIIDAYFKSPSTTDYNGLYKGKYIDFEAKETTNKTSFPLRNIGEHQIKHLEKVIKHHGIGFLIIRFTHLDKTFLLFANDFLNYISSSNKKSIPLDIFENKGYEIETKYSPRLDYIKIIEKYGGIKWKN